MLLIILISIHLYSTIFKTIADKTTLSGQKIVGALQARKIIQQQAVQQLQTDIQCLKQYELACQRGTVTSKDFNNTMHNASAEAQSYAVNIKNGTGSIQVYANTQKELQASLKATSIASRIANTGIKILSATLNTIISTAIFSLISKGISLATEKINNLIHHNELVIDRKSVV